MKHIKLSLLTVLLIGATNLLYAAKPEVEVTTTSDSKDIKTGPTAFALIKEGNRYIGEDSKDKVVQIRSEKSIGSLTPSYWYIVYYDEDATAKSVEVKFGGGKKMAVKRQPRVLEIFSKESKPLNREKLKVDSDKALEVALKEDLLTTVRLTNTEMKLERWGEEDAPTWKIKIWAQQARHPEKTVDIGEIFISASEGKVVKLDLHINRVD